MTERTELYPAPKEEIEAWMKQIKELALLADVPEHKRSPLWFHRLSRLLWRLQRQTEDQAAAIEGFLAAEKIRLKDEKKERQSRLV